MVRIRHDVKADAVYVRLSTKRYSYGEDLDDERRVDYAADGTPVGVELLNVSMGVKVNGLPAWEQIARALQQEGIETYLLELGATSTGTGSSMKTSSLVLFLPSRAEQGAHIPKEKVTA